MLAVILVSGALFLSIWVAGIIPVGHWGFAIGVNFLFMAVYTIIFDTLFSPAYSAKYFIARPFERKGSIYQWFGVNYYKYLLRLIGWEKIIRKDQVIKRNMDSLLEFVTWTKGSEAIHLIAAISVIAFTIWIGWHYSISDIRWLIITNVLFNVYPVMLQRYNRPRIIRLINFQKTRIRNR